MKRLFAWILTMTLCAGMLTGCGSASTEAVAVEDTQGMPAANQQTNDAEVQESGLTDTKTMVLEPQDDRKIIYNADLSLESKEFVQTRDALLEAAAKADAYMQQSSEGGSEEWGSRWIDYTFRVPSQNYQDFLNSASESGNLLNKSESTEDVTANYVDVEARLDSLQKQESRLLELANQAESLEDLLAIEKQLTDVRYQIERYTGQKNVMDNQIAYSTVNVHLSEVQTLTPTSQKFGTRIKTAFQGSWENFVEGCQDFLIGLIYMLPGLVILAVIVVVFVLVLKKVQKKRPKKVANTAAVAQQTAKYGPADAEPDKTKK